MNHKLFPDDVSGALALAGFLGSIVSAVFDWKGWVATARKVTVGSICALYIGPAAAPMAAKIAPSVNALTLSGFVVGLCGLLVVEIIVETVKHRFAVKEAEDAQDA